jgi:hypothetical protein
MGMVCRTRGEYEIFKSKTMKERHELGDLDGKLLLG